MTPDLTTLRERVREATGAAATLERAKTMKRIERIEIANHDWSGPVSEFIQMLQQIEADHPSAVLTIETYSEYVTAYAEYERDETESECEARLRRERADAARKERDDLRRDKSAFDARDIPFPDQARLDELEAMFEVVARETPKDIPDGVVHIISEHGCCMAINGNVFWTTPPVERFLG